MKIFIGIDFAKEKFDAALIAADSAKGEPIEYGVFENNDKGIRKMLKWVKDTHPKSKREDLVFCGENTGVYSRPVAEFLSSKGYKICIENAYRIKQSSGLIRGKNDRKDAAIIADYILRHEDEAAEFKSEKPVLKNLDTLFKQRRFLVKQASETKCKLESLDFEAGRKYELSATLDKYCIIKGSRLTLKFDKLASLSVSDTAVVECLAMLKIYEWQTDELDRKMKETIEEDDDVKENFDIITSIPGVALQNAVAMILCTDNFEKFGFDARKLACYYGVAVFGKESGTSVYAPPHTSHLANKQLKSLLTQAAVVSVTHCKPIRAYYSRLIAKGKKQQVVLNNVKNKLLHMIMSMVRHRTKYDEDAYGKSAKTYNTQICA